MHKSSAPRKRGFAAKGLQGRVGMRARDRGSPDQEAAAMRGSSIAAGVKVRTRSRPARLAA